MIKSAINPWTQSLLPDTDHDMSTYLSSLALCCGRSRRQNDAEATSPGPNTTSRLPQPRVPGETNDQQVLHESPLRKAVRGSTAAEPANLLEALPVELVQHVIRFLAPDSRALMALASKLCMILCGGTDCMKLAPKYRGPFFFGSRTRLGRSRMLQRLR